MKTKLLFITLLSVIISWGQATLPLTRTGWNTTPTGWTDTPLDSYLSTFACSGSNGAKFDTTGDVKTVNFNSAPDKLSFVIKSNTSTTSSLLIEESNDGVSYSTVVNLSGAGDLPTTCTSIGPLSLNNSSRYVRWTFTKGSSNLTMDDVSITALSTTPTITITPTTLSSFNYFVGNGPSTEQTFTLSGVNLTTDILLSAPTNTNLL